MTGTICHVLSLGLLMGTVKSVPDPLPLSLQGTPAVHVDDQERSSLRACPGFCWCQAQSSFWLDERLWLDLPLMVTMSPVDRAREPGDWVVPMSPQAPYAGLLDLHLKHRFLFPGASFDLVLVFISLGQEETTSKHCP